MHTIMRPQKSKYINHSPLEDSDFPKSTNILDLIVKNKLEEKKEKKNKIYTISSFAILIFLLAVIIF